MRAVRGRLFSINKICASGASNASLLPLETRVSPMKRAPRAPSKETSALLRESCESLGSHQSPPTTPAWSPLDGAARQSALQGAAATEINWAALHEAIDRCWAHPQRAAGRGAAPRPQIHHDAAAAPGRPHTARWLPNRGRAQASRHSCGRRRPKRPATPHR